MRPPSFARRALAALLLAHLLAVLAMAASPQMHHWVHHDADHDDHDCAVTLFLHGGGDAAPAPTVVPAFVGFETAPLTLIWLLAAFVPSSFAESRVFEHAPPLSG